MQAKNDICGRWTAALAASVLAACSTQGTGRATVSGLVQADAPVAASVTVRDSSAPPQARTVDTRPDGSFAVDLSGLKAPFVLRAQWTGLVGSRQLYGTAGGAGAADLNQLTDTAFAGAAASRGTSAEEFGRSGSGDAARTSREVTAMLQQLQTVLAPLFARYAITDPATDVRAVRSLLRDVRFAVKDGALTVTNRETGGVIFAGSLSDLASGTLDEENMPPGPAAPSGDGAMLYDQNCAGCHGPLATSNKRGATAERIQAAIDANTGSMGSLGNLTADQVRSIADALSGGSTPPPSGDGEALYGANCAGCHGPISSSSVRGASANDIREAIDENEGGMGSLRSLTPDEVGAIAAALGGGGGDDDGGDDDGGGDD